MVQKKLFKGISLCIAYLIIFTVFFSTQTEEVNAIPIYGHGTIKVSNINYSSRTLTLIIDFYEVANTTNANERSSSWLWFIQPYGALGSSLFSNDTNWHLTGNNGIEWKIEKTIEVQYDSIGETYDFFPFEQYQITLYMLSNFSRQLDSLGSDVPNFDCSIKQKSITQNQGPFFLVSPQYQGLSIYHEIDITVNQNVPTIFTALIIYALFFILITVGFIIFRKRLEMKLSDSITILSSVLIFLPILLFTFRTSYGPNSLTPVDYVGFLIMIGYGLILLIDLLMKKWKVRLKDCDYDF